MSHANDPSLTSFIPVAPDSPFPIQNLPFGVFRPTIGGSPRIGSAIGEYVIDLAELEDIGLFDGPELDGERVFARTSLNDFMALGQPAWREAREKLSLLLRDDEPTIRDHPGLRHRLFFKQSEVEMLDPVEIGDYTDFYSSIEHATNVGTLFRGKDNALQPNWRHLPVAYHGRSSSVVLSGTGITRPNGQQRPTRDETPGFGPSQKLDYELEVGFFTGPGNRPGEPIPIRHHHGHIFGLTLVNDWSARDIQAWEYVPLGPFLGKNFATSISPWVVLLDALEPFRTPGPDQAPAPLPYLRQVQPSSYDIILEVAIVTPEMAEPEVISRTNFSRLYWSIAQQLAHHTINGCNIRPGDLLASGTISGPDPESVGSLLERTHNGTQPLTLGNGQQRTFLEDGDTVVMRGYCQGKGYRIGLGEVSGTVLPASHLTF